MARATQRQRLDLSSPEETGGPWTVVGRKGRRKARLPTPPAQYRQYKLLHHQEQSEFLAITRLEKEYPNLSVRVSGSSGSGFTLRPTDEETAFLLDRLAKEEPFGICLEGIEVETRGVVQRYPQGFPLDPILADPRVTFARRCTYNAGHGRREPTRQVEVTFGGKLPDSLDLGSWGVYSVRRYIREPLRCYKCQAFGHVQKHCRTGHICGVCSKRHPTSECISALRAGDARVARCPNCGKGHHAWSKLCPERLRRLPPCPRGRGEDPPNLIDTQPLPAAPAKVSRRAMRERSASPTLPTTTATATSTERTRKRRRRRRKRSTVAVPARAPTPTPAVAPTPTTSEAATQTEEEQAPEPELWDCGTQTAVPKRHKRVQASPELRDVEVLTDIHIPIMTLPNGQQLEIPEHLTRRACERTPGPYMTRGRYNESR